jgi:hypothetical protein
MNSTKQARMTEGPVGRTLVSLTIPMLLAVLTIVIFNLVDTAFVGRLSTQKLAAISFTFPVILVIGSLAQGLGIGASAVISQAIGRGGLRPSPCSLSLRHGRPWGRPRVCNLSRPAHRRLLFHFRRAAPFVPARGLRAPGPRRPHFRAGPFGVFQNVS